MKRTLCLIPILLALANAALATPTEHLRFRILPAPGKVVVDGKVDDWDLSGGIFACGDVEEQRDKYAVWIHAMYDADNLYLFAHFVDETPLNNPGQTGGDAGFQGDSLQMRFITGAGTPAEQVVHITAWRGRDGRNEIDMERVKRPSGKGFNAIPQGAQEAFTVDADGKGYVQEIALPWKFLTKDGHALQAGDTLTITAEPNFTVNAKNRLTIKDIFRPGVSIDRIFTFQSPQVWGAAKLEANGHVTPQPVRLADAREFPVKLEGNRLVVDWTGLSVVKELPALKTIRFTMPEDGFISLNIEDASGQPVRQLLNNAFFTKGAHEAKWDGLTTPNWNVPGDAVKPGTYTWRALWHKEIGLRLRGWACNAGSAPWDNGPTTSWGGDEGNPTCAATGEGKVLLGWSCAEAGKALVVADLDGRVLFRHKRGGVGAVKGAAIDRGVIYVLGSLDGAGNVTGGSIYKLDATNSDYLSFAGDVIDLGVKYIWPGEIKPPNADSIDAKNGKLYLSFPRENLVAILDGTTGRFIKSLPVASPTSLKAMSDDLLYVLSSNTVVTGDSHPIVTVPNAVAMTVDAAGNFYVGADNQVNVFDSAGKPLRTIGRPGGRALSGPWTPGGMAFISGLAVDADGKLWVAERCERPKRFSVWDTKTGQLWKEFLGPSDYGATGGAINPLDPNLMIGQGCEWRLDPATGRDTLLGVVSTNGMLLRARNQTKEGVGCSRFAVGANGRLYLAWSKTFNRECPIWIFERLGDGNYKLRAELSGDSVWTDENGDEQVQPNEVTHLRKHFFFGGWYVTMAPDLTFYASNGARRDATLYQIKVTGFTACGAPKYDFDNVVAMPGSSGLGTLDGRRVLVDGGGEHGWFNCIDVATGKTLWTYPDTYVGVHGSHNAPPPQAGLIEGAYGVVGTAKLPAPAGQVWVIGTNVGEWHLLTEDGFYLARLFQPDPLKVKWPATAAPGADMTDCPPGGGQEDFGGSMAQGKDGKLYLQAGNTAYWNLDVTGLDSVREITGERITINEADMQTAYNLRDQQLQARTGPRAVAVKHLAPTFTGDIDKDFAGAEFVTYQKSDETKTRSAATWDEQNLYLAWDVADDTPWVNGAKAPEQMYTGGDTVDFQLATDPAAKNDRSEPVLGDLRLSIGNFAGKPTAVLYRKVAREKHPKSFSSGLVKSYGMDSVVVLPDVNVKVKVRRGGYVIEAAIPVAALEFKPAAGLALRGDFGATFGDPAGQRTRLRSYWSNQQTGLVNDAVYELMLAPRNWGELLFKK